MEAGLSGECKNVDSGLEGKDGWQNTWSEK